MSEAERLRIRLIAQGVAARNERLGVHDVALAGAVGAVGEDQADVVEEDAGCDPVCVSANVLSHSYGALEKRGRGGVARIRRGLGRGPEFYALDTAARVLGQAARVAHVDRDAAALGAVVVVAEEGPADGSRAELRGEGVHRGVVVCGGQGGGEEAVHKQGQQDAQKSLGSSRVHHVVVVFGSSRKAIDSLGLIWCC